MMIPVNNYLIVRLDIPEEVEGGFHIADTNKYLRLNHGKAEVCSDGAKEFQDKVVYFRDFQGVDIDKDLIALHKDDIVVYKEKE